MLHQSTLSMRTSNLHCNYLFHKSLKGLFHSRDFRLHNVTFLTERPFLKWDPGTSNSDCYCPIFKDALFVWFTDLHFLSFTFLIPVHQQDSSSSALFRRISRYRGVTLWLRVKFRVCL
jgi:hypothetical protein